MPLYTYRCGACDTEFEALVRPNKPEPEACQACGKKQIARQLSRFAITHSEVDSLRSLDPMYKRMVEDQMARTPEAEPMRLLNKLTPFDAAQEVGDPIDF
ncbi:MAG: zinc ribbon domain-containing protein [Dehalococcoidia bacterium]